MKPIGKKKRKKKEKIIFFAKWKWG